MQRQKPVATLLLTGIFLLGGIAAQADTPSYRYAELVYSTGELDVSVDNLGSESIDQDGFELDGSFSFLDDRLWVFGSYSDLSGDESGIDIDIKTGTVGGGFILPFGANAAADFSVFYRTDELSALGLSDDIDGVGFGAGVRGNVAEPLELYGRLGYLTGDYEGGFVFDAGGVISLTELFAITVSYELLSADDEGVDLDLGQFQIGARLTF